MSDYLVMKKEPISNQEKEHHNEFHGFSLDQIEDKFSKLAEEIQTGGVNLHNLIEESQNNPEEDANPHFRNYQPTIKDFLERAKTVEECLEIIEYCSKQGEITVEEELIYKDRLKRGGPRAFGTRENGYYDNKL